MVAPEQNLTMEDHCIARNRPSSLRHFGSKRLPLDPSAYSVLLRFKDFGCLSKQEKRPGLAFIQAESTGEIQRQGTMDWQNQISRPRTILPQQAHISTS